MAGEVISCVEFDAQRREVERLAADAEDVQARERIERQLERKGTGGNK